MTTLLGAGIHFEVGIRFDGEFERFSSTPNKPDKVIDLNQVDLDGLTDAFYEKVEVENKLPVPLIRLAGILVAQEADLELKDKEFIYAPRVGKSERLAIVHKDFEHYFEPILEAQNWEKGKDYEVLGEAEFNEAALSAPKYVFGEMGSQAQYISRGHYKGIDSKNNPYFIAYRGPDSSKQHALWWGMCLVMMSDFPPLDRAKLFEVMLNRGKYDYDYVKYRKANPALEDAPVPRTRRDNKQYGSRKKSPK